MSGFEPSFECFIRGTHRDLPARVFADPTQCAVNKYSNAMYVMSTHVVLFTDIGVVQISHAP